MKLLAQLNEFSFSADLHFYLPDGSCNTNDDCEAGSYCDENTCRLSCLNTQSLECPNHVCRPVVVGDLSIKLCKDECSNTSDSCQEGHICVGRDNGSRSILCSVVFGLPDKNVLFQSSSRHQTRISFSVLNGYYLQFSNFRYTLNFLIFIYVAIVLNLNVYTDPMGTWKC